MLLVDVREPNETAVERYPDAVIVPLSASIRPHIPDPQGKQVVFACRSGRRSVTASLAAQDAGLPLRLASRRRHPGLEGRRPADQNLNDADAAARMLPSLSSSPLRPRPSGTPSRAGAGARRQRLQLVGLYRPDGARGFHQGDRHQGPLRHLRLQRDAGDQAARRQVRLRRGGADRLFPRSARSRPACSRSSTRQAAEPRQCLAGDRQRGSPSTIPATNTPSTTCGARPASATT